MNETPSGHIPVLLDGVLSMLEPESGGSGEAGGAVYLDCTAGFGGHAAGVAQAMARGARPGDPAGTVVLNDWDPASLSRAGERVRGTGTPVGIESIRGNFAEAPRRLERLGLSADMVLADLGFASAQLEDPSRGLSFSRDGPLDMRMDPGLPVTAADLVATLSEDELARVLREYGQERLARRVAAKLVQVRRGGPISTTGQLARIVRSVVGRSGSIDPATRTFQALRIAVNDEIGNLEALLAQIQRGCRLVAEGSPGWLRPGARVALVTFHSLEDRPVKRAFRSLADEGLAQLLCARPIRADREEARLNPRARSARLRAIRVGTGTARREALT